MRRLSLLAVALLCARPLSAQLPDAAALPSDPAVVRGQLDNGLRYLIRRNAQPRNRAELRLVVAAGSILESDAQRGLAHFVEHMAFNGTRRFPRSAIVDYLERTGMRFGADVNAYTSFDETVYMLQVPTDTAQIVSTGLDILEDWAHGLSFDSTEIRKERGVVIEEWRTGRGAMARVQNKQFPVMLRGSKYAERLPIGTRENLESFPDSLPRQFYHDWYRPDLMTVVAVGDFDPVQMETMIKERFSRLVMPANPRRREFAAVPDHDETLVSIETDKEYPSSAVALLWLRSRDSTRTVADLRRQLVAGFYDAMVNQRFSEAAQRPDAPFAYAGSGRGGLVRTKDAYQLFAAVKESGFEKAEAALLTEAERVAQLGFTQTELDRTRTQYLRGLDQAYAERDKTNSNVFAGQYVSSALSGAPILSIEQRQTLAKQIAPAITLADVNALARSSITEKNRVVLVSAPDKPEVKVPSAAAMLATLARARASTFTAYVDSASDSPLLPGLPRPGRIVAERLLPETGITEWTLSNGARVLLKPTDFKDDEILFAGRSPGGTSLLGDRDVLTADLSNAALSVSGVGQFNQIALGKKLTGKRAYASTNVSEQGEYVNAGGSARDLETIFQLVWLRFTSPRVDSVAYAALKAQARAMMANQRNSPEAVFNDTVRVTMVQHSPRVRLFTPELLDSLDLQKGLDLYRDRFADASGFTFYLVGSFRLDSVRPLVAQYLASLPALHRNEKIQDRGIRPPSGVVERTVRKGMEPKATT
ncbi:MAG: peptidase domain protein, partial [Gemmatimonadetes bacterium]|nr:peptidase domain protein [Gemmatimonadota bacterium]